VLPLPQRNSLSLRGDLRVCLAGDLRVYLAGRLGVQPIRYYQNSRLLLQLPYPPSPSSLRRRKPLLRGLNIKA